MSLINCAEPDLDTIELIECDCVSGSAGEDGIHSGRHDRTEEVRRPSSRGSVLRPAAGIGTEVHCQTLTVLCVPAPSD